MKTIKHTRQKQLCPRIKQGPVIPPIDATTITTTTTYFSTRENTLDSITIYGVSSLRYLSHNHFPSLAARVLQHTLRMFHKLHEPTYHRCNTLI